VTDVSVLADAATTVATGSILLAIPFAFIAGLVSFFSPCVLPLVPAYLSYVTGMTGAELAELSEGQRDDDRGEEEPGEVPSEPDPSTGAAAAAGATVATASRTAAIARARSRVLLGTVLFVLGFSAVFVSFGAAFGGLGARLLEYSDVITRVLGVLTIVLGLAFMGLIPWLQREARFHVRPSVGLAGAPMLGVIFGLGWTPCIGPTLAAVQTLAYSTATAGRGALLSLVYCLGLGLPFIVAALAFSRSMRAFGWVRQHYAVVMRVGGAVLVLLGVALVTGWWTQWSIDLRVWVSSFEPAL
jgi:cytochrome c-type biogenesis protein